MADLFQTLSEAPDHVVERVADGLEIRAKDPAQLEILERYIRDLEIPDGAQVLEMGCGTGPVCRRFAEIAEVEQVFGIDPARKLIERARVLADGNAKLQFDVARAESTGFDDDTLDLVILHTLLSHVPDQGAVLDEARRILKPGGWLAVCDADFSKTSVAIGDADPLQACADVWVAGNVTDLWLIPKLPGLLRQKGFEIKAFRGHNRLDTAGIGTGPVWINIGIDTLLKEGRISEETAVALRQECQDRIDQGRFFASLPFASAVAVKA